MTLAVRKTADLEVRPPIREQARQYLVGKRIEAVAVTRRQAWTAWQVARQLPGTGLRLVCYSPRGLARVTAAWARYLNDYDTADLRAHHAKVRESKEYKAVSDVRSANLTARIMVNGTAAAFVLGVVFAWTWPPGFGALLGLLVFVWTIKLIPGRHLGEVGVAAILAFVAFFAGPWLAGKMPVPPAWAFWLVGTGAVGGLGWAGRPRARPLVNLPDAGRVPRLTAPMVAAALCTLGSSKMKEPDDIRLLFDVARHGQGYQVDLELPPGVRASWVIERREDLASALRRELGCVFLMVGTRHPAHLVVYVSDQPMSLQDQDVWPLAHRGRVDIFEPQPIATNQRGEWVMVTLAYASMIIGAIPRMGKTFLLRLVLLVAALDPRVRIYALDGKGTGDLSPLSSVAHFYSRGRKPEEIERVRAMVRELRAEMIRRSDFLDSLSEEECPENKVTSELATKYPRQLCPIVIGIDETQAYFDYGEKKNKEHAAIRVELEAGFTEIVRLGPALGIIWLGATQNVNAVTVPRGISTNVVIRACLKVTDHVANDQILGTSSYSKGIDATQFDFNDKGLLFLSVDGGRPQIVRSVAGMDAAAAKVVAARARALRAAAGMLSGDADDVEDAVVVVDVVADVFQVLRHRGLHAAHHAELAEWLRELRPADYADLTVEQLSARLRDRAVVVSQVWRNGRNLQGIDLRKQLSDQAALSS